MWLSERKVTFAPFSKMRTMVFPKRRSPFTPCNFLCLRERERSSRYSISLGVKSLRVSKLLPRRLMGILSSLLIVAWFFCLFVDQCAGGPFQERFSLKEISDHGGFLCLFDKIAGGLHFWPAGPIPKTR